MSQAHEMLPIYIYIVSDCSKHAYDEVTEYIGREGKIIEINGCSITFSMGCFDRTQQVSVKAYINPKSWPRDTIGITPTLHVQAPDLKVPAKVKLTTWCVNDPDDEDAIVEVLRFDSYKYVWEVVHTCLLGTSQEIKFEVGQFSKLFGSIKNYAGVLHKLTACVHHTGRRFAVATMLDDDTAKRSCFKKIADEIGVHENDHNCDTFECKDSHSIRIKIRCCSHNDTFEFTPRKFKFKTDEVEKAGGSRVFFPTLRCKEKEAEVDVRFTLFRDKRRLIDNTFPYEWKPKTVEVNLNEEPERRARTKVRTEIVIYSLGLREMHSTCNRLRRTKYPVSV